MHPLLAGTPVVIELAVAWADMDSFAHVNNTVYFRYFENARVEWLDRVGWFASMRDVGIGPIVASTQAKFRKPVTYPDRLFVGAKPIAIGEDRVTLEHVLVSEKWNAVAAEGQAVVVCYDYRAGTKIAIPDALKQKLQ